jgi:NodT family efflux transporter outer membrane factor (OMF) lipoprotein
MNGILRNGLMGMTAAALAAACAVKQPPAPADALKTVMPPTTVVPSTYKATTGAAGPVAADWVHTFNDPQLQTLVDEGLNNNLDLKAAVSRIDVAAAIVVQARSLLYPQITAVAGLGIVGRDDVKNRNGLAAEMNWELDLWGRVRAQAASASASREASEADLLFARQSLAATVATLWFDTVTNERLRQTAADSIQIYADLLDLVRQRNQVGQVGQEDVNLAGADLDRARRRERGYETSKQQIVRGLEVVVGRYPSAELALAPALPPMPGPVPEGLPAELLTRRSDLIAAERRVASAFHLIQVAEASRWPTISLTAGGGRSTSDLLYLAGVPPEFWRFGANILAPLFTGGALQAQVTRATAEQQAALALYGQTVLRAFSEVESSLAKESLLLDQQRYLEAVLAQDTEAVRLGRLRYQGGATDLLHVLNLQARQLDTQYNLLGIQNERLANRVALHLALGGGFAPAPPTPPPPTP